MAEKNNENPDSSVGEPDSPRPLVLVVVDGWGIGAKYPGNLFADLELKTFSELVKNYPLAIIDSEERNINERYKILGAGGKLSRALSDHGLSQINLLESEKFLPAWYHFNGQRDYLLNKEDWQIVSSPLSLDDDNFEDNIDSLVKIALDDIKRGNHDFINLNLANLSLVAQSKNIELAKESIKMLDKKIGLLVDAVLKQDGVLIFTAAYGHAEALINPNSELFENAPSRNPVPCFIIGREFEGKTFGLPDAISDDLSLMETVGGLDRVAPTILKILKLEKPEGMDVDSLI